MGRSYSSEAAAVVPAWFSSITRMSLAALWCFQRLTPESMTEWLWRNANRGGKTPLRNSFQCYFHLKKWEIYTFHCNSYPPLLSFNRCGHIDANKVNWKADVPSVSPSVPVFASIWRRTRTPCSVVLWKTAKHLSTLTYKLCQYPFKRTPSSGFEDLFLHVTWIPTRFCVRLMVLRVAADLVCSPVAMHGLADHLVLVCFTVIPPLSYCSLPLNPCAAQPFFWPHVHRHPSPTGMGRIHWLQSGRFQGFPSMQANKQTAVCFFKHSQTLFAEMCSFYSFNIYSGDPKKSTRPAIQGVVVFGVRALLLENPAM